MFGFSGDEYHGYDDLRSEEQKRRDWLASHGQPDEPVVNEYEAFSQDQAWMPTVVLIAKSTYVWLEQLSKQYKRHIHRLDQIPREELQTLADRGMNGLWLIGLWERSVASQTIKRMRGQHDAVASAYSLMDYRIAEDLGGNAAYEVLRERARNAGFGWRAIWCRTIWGSIRLGWSSIRIGLSRVRRVRFRCTASTGRTFRRMGGWRFG